MKTKRKRLIRSLIIIIIITGFIIFILNALSFTDCEQVEVWKVGKYKVIRSRCIGPAGPPYYPLTIYKGMRELKNARGFQLDSCVIRFQPKKNIYLRLNICDDSFIEINPEKEIIEHNEIDSIMIYSKQLQKFKLLNLDQIEIFISDWNRSAVFDYREGHIDSVFYPDYKYKIFVYTEEKNFEFIAFNFLISDRTNWTYDITENKNADYFSKIWNN